MLKNYFSLLCLLGFLGGGNYLFSQKPQPESTLKFPYKTAEAEIQQKIESSQSVFLQEQWSAVELFVRQNNNAIDSKIREIDAQTDDVYRKLKQLYAASNIIELQNNVRALEASRQKILEETEKQLQQITFRGVYLAIVNGVKPYDKDAAHVENIKNAILPDAVTALNGAFLQNIVALKDNKVEYDYLTERVSGSMTMGGVEFEERSFSGGYFVQVRQVEVSPLQQKMATSGITTAPKGQTAPNVSISDLLNNPDGSSVLSKLTDAELRAKIDKCIMEKVPTVASEVRNYNLAAAQNEAAIVQEAKEKLADLDKKITLAKADLERNMENAKKVMTDAGIAFDPTRLAEGIAAARQKLLSQLNVFNTQKKQVKTDELVLKVFDVSAQGGEPASALAREAASKAAVMQTEYSQIRGFFREIKLENQTVSDYSAGSSADAYRELESYWLYPVPNSNSFRLGIVGKFKMTDTPPKGQEVVLIKLETAPPKTNTPSPVKTEIEPQKPVFIRTKQFDLDPRLAQPELKQAESYFEQEKFSDAYAIYEKHFGSQALQAHHQVQIGYMLRNGFGTRQDYYNAFKWYMKAAQQGDSGGQCNVAYMYKNGYGTAIDYEQAVKWYRLSADQGNAMSENNLGYMYEKGLGVKRNMPEAITLYRKAARQGNDLAIKNLERLGL